MYGHLSLGEKDKVRCNSVKRSCTAFFCCEFGKQKTYSKACNIGLFPLVFALR